MKPFTAITILAGVVALSVTLGRAIELGAPTNGTVLQPGQNFTAEVIQPESTSSCIEVGIALAIASCKNGACPQPTDGLGNVLYAGSWTPTTHSSGVIYQNFTLQVPSNMATGAAVFTLTHFCLLGTDPVPFLDYHEASVTIG